MMTTTDNSRPSALRYRLLPLLWLAACSTLPTPAERASTAQALTLPGNWQASTLSSSTFMLRSYGPPHIRADQPLSIYIEGDGFAWLNREQPSGDPTPIDPLALRLALAQPDGNAVYLARPCQYLAAQDRRCAQRYWTDARFSADVIQATDEAISQLKARYGARRLSLIGYSGGAAVAALVAAGRHDVDRLITVAGNLDSQAWTEHHRISPLRHSLNPADAAKRLAQIPQWHLLGQQDRVIPALIAQSFARRAPAQQQLIIPFPGFDHHCCWAAQWPKIWRQLESGTLAP